MGFLRFLRDNAPFLTAGVMLSFTSSYGQTFFISLFAGEIMRDFKLSHGQWGLIYAVATTVSAVAMIWAGALTDKFRVRQLSVAVCICLAIACLAMTAVRSALVLGVVIFALRLAGQGMMSHLSIVAMARWFQATRGKALSVAAMGFAMGQAILPLCVVALLTLFDWRSLWGLAAAFVLLTAPIIHRLLQAERTPQSVAESTSVAGMGGRQWNRAQMLRHWLFWGIVPLLLGPPAFGTALFFHQVHLTEIKGWPLADFVALMPLFTLVSIVFTFVFGALIDGFGTGRLMQAYMLPFAVSFFVLAQAETLWGAGLGMAIFGLCIGAQATVPSAFWAEFFGTRHLGAIKALAASVMVFGSAVGPGVTALLIDNGISFPKQMFGIATYFLMSGVLAAVVVGRAQRDLSLPPEVHIIGT